MIKSRQHIYCCRLFCIPQYISQMRCYTIFMPTFSWSSIEYEYEVRSTDWYWYVGTAGVVFAGLAVYFSNTLFGIVILLAAGSLILFANKQPQPVDITIDMHGIRLSNDLYTWNNITHFWIEAPDGNKPRHLLFVTKRLFMPQISLKIEDIDPVALRTFLIERCEEKELHELPLLELFEKFGL